MALCQNQRSQILTSRSSANATNWYFLGSCTLWNHMSRRVYCGWKLLMKYGKTSKRGSMKVTYSGYQIFKKRFTCTNKVIHQSLNTLLI